MLKAQPAGVSGTWNLADTSAAGKGAGARTGRAPLLHWSKAVWQAEQPRRHCGVRRSALTEGVECRGCLT